MEEVSLIVLEGIPSIKNEMSQGNRTCRKTFLICLILRQLLFVFQIFSFNFCPACILSTGLSVSITGVLTVSALLVFIHVVLEDVFSFI